MIWTEKKLATVCHLSVDTLRIGLHNALQCPITLTDLDQYIGNNGDDRPDLLVRNFLYAYEDAVTPDTTLHAFYSTIPSCFVLLFVSRNALLSGFVISRDALNTALLRKMAQLETVHHRLQTLQESFA